MKKMTMKVLCILALMCGTLALAETTAEAQSTCYRVHGVDTDENGFYRISNPAQTMPYVVFYYDRRDGGIPAPYCFDAPNIGIRTWYDLADGPCFHKGTKVEFYCADGAIMYTKAGMALPEKCGSWHARYIGSELKADGERLDSLAGSTYVNGPPCIYAEEPIDSCSEAFSMGLGGYFDPYTGEYITCDSPILVPIGVQGNREEIFRLKDGVLFDIDGDGDLDRIGWTQRGVPVGFLFIDRNKNGLPDNGRELLGNYTIPGVYNGFHALAKLSGLENKAAYIEEGDTFFKELLLWVDSNHDGVGQTSEIEPFSKYYVSIALGYEPDNYRDRYGNQFAFKGFAERRDPSGRVDPFKNPMAHRARFLNIYDVFFVKQQ